MKTRWILELQIAALLTSTLCLPGYAYALAKPATTLRLDGVDIPREMNGPAAHTPADTANWTYTGRQGIGRVSVELHLPTNRTAPFTAPYYLELAELAGRGYGTMTYMTGPRSQQYSSKQWLADHKPALNAGAWGYNTPLGEQWYSCMRWNCTTQWHALKQGTWTWTKFRKVLVTNLTTGRMVVTDAGDWGPGIGNRIGGLSPDVMFWASNQKTLKDYNSAAPSTDTGYDPATDYFYEWVINPATPLGPLRRTSTYVPTNAVVYQNTSRTGMGYAVSRKIAGRLAAEGGQGRRPVDLYTSLTNVTWKYMKRTSTDAAGNYSFTVNPTTKRFYQVRFARSGKYASARSQTFSWQPRARFDAVPVAPKVATHGKTYTISVRMSPRHRVGDTATTFSVQRLIARRWIVYATYKGRATNYGTSQSAYAIRALMGPAGSWRVVAIHQDVGHAKTTSPCTTFTVN